VPTRKGIDTHARLQELTLEQSRRKEGSRVGGLLQ
jgi:hypothetical protein